MTEKDKPKVYLTVKDPNGTVHRCEGFSNVPTIYESAKDKGQEYVKELICTKSVGEDGKTTIEKIKPISFLVDTMIQRGVVASPQDLEKMSKCDHMSFVNKDTGLVIEIYYDPNVEKMYERRERSTHDGTMLFTHEVLTKTIGVLTRGESYYKPHGVPDIAKIKKIKYTIGDIELKTEYRDKVKLPVGEFPGQIDDTSMPVRVEYEYKEII